MKAFEYVNARDLKHASALLGDDPKRAKVLAGGIDLLSEMKEHIIEPDRVVNIKTIKDLDYIRADQSGLRIGALATLAEIEQHAGIRRAYTALAEAAESIGSPQIRNVGTLGGNLCQRPRCWYYRDETVICIKKGGGRCYASDPEGENKYNAILGGGPSFIVHPSDCAPALVALNAVVKISGPKGVRDVPLQSFFTLPNQNVLKENVLEPNELVTEVRVPRPAAGTRSTFLKFQEREAFDWAVASVAAVLTMQNGVCREARVVLGGVAPIPWRSPEAEAVLKGRRIDADVAARAADTALAKARPLSRNGYKVPVAKVLVRRAILAAAGTPAA